MNTVSRRRSCYNILSSFILQDVMIQTDKMEVWRLTLLMDISGHNANFAFSGFDNSGTVRSDQSTFSLLAKNILDLNFTVRDCKIRFLYRFEFK